jgi:L-ascorbate metabolism protein UlaG (beta-lactamase superfamily)
VRVSTAICKRSIFTALIWIMVLFSCSGPSYAQYWQKDTLQTSKGNVEIEIVGHCFLHFVFNRMHIYVDPIPNVADLTRLPKADLILITHEHRDHLNTDAIEFLSKPETKVIASKSCISKMNFGQFLENGMQTTFNNIYIKAVAAYNVVNLRPDDVPYHPKGDGNGYFMVFGDKTIYISGDTEYIDEMRFFLKPDVAFITIMIPFTMDEEMFIQTVKKLKPKILYPLYYNVDMKSLVEQLSTALPEMKVRVPY